MNRDALLGRVMVKNVGSTKGPFALARKSGGRHTA